MLRNLIMACLLAPCFPALAYAQDLPTKADKGAVGQETVKKNYTTEVTLADLVKVEKSIQDMYANALACTVAVGRKGRPAGASGVVVSEDGLVLTAAHVITSTGDEVEIYFSDGRKVKGRALGTNAAADAGMIQITDKAKYPFAKVRRASELETNDWCIMMGHPQQLQKKRSAPVRVGRFLDLNKSKRGYVRTSCTMMAGDSGGPLFDLQGRVIGINSNIGVPVTQNYHVSSDVFVDTWDRMRKGERWGQRRGRNSPDRVILGFNVQKNAAGRLRISRVQRFASAESAGIKLGDILLEIEGKSIEDPRTIGTLLKGTKAGDTLAMKLERGDEEFEVQVKLRSARQVSAAMRRDRSSRGSRGSNRGTRGRTARSRGATSTRWVGTGSGNPFRNKGKLPFHGPYLRDVRLVLDGVVAKTSRSVVPVYVGKAHVAMATAVRKNGYLLTKASEIEGRQPVVRIGEKRLPARVVQRFPAYDLAMIKIDADLPYVALNKSMIDTRVGTLVIGAGPRKNNKGQAMELGVVSVAQRSMNARRPYLGVSFEARSSGLRVRTIERGSSAAKMGLVAGDEVLELNGKPYKTVATFIADLKRVPAGDPIQIGIDQEGALLLLEGKVGSKFDDDRVGRLHLVGGQLSKRRVGFASAIQTDLTLDPAQCGSPLVGLDGQILGINIARSRRVASYAIPTSVLRKLIKQRRIEKL